MGWPGNGLREVGQACRQVGAWVDNAVRNLGESWQGALRRELVQRCRVVQILWVGAGRGAEVGVIITSVDGELRSIQ